MSLQAGDTIRVTKADNVSDNYSKNYVVRKALDVEWDGVSFLGCTADAGHRHQWTLDVMLHFVEESSEKPETRTNIDCMVEQLVAEGAIG